MALNLSTLTSPANSSVLEEVNTTADFLEPCPVLRNLSRGSNKGGDAKQDVALNQPKALPLIDGDGYLYVSGVTGNYASIAHDSSLNLTNQLEVVARVKYRSYTGSDAQTIIAKWAQGDFNFRFSTQGKLEIFHKDSSNTTHGIASFEALSANNISDGDTIWVKATIDATTTTASFNFYSSKDNVKNESDVSWTALGAARTLSTGGGISSSSNSVVFGAVSTAGNDDLATGAVLKANYKAAIGGTPVLDVDFTATNIRHGDTKFKCATGQVVTINKSGNDPATIIKKPVLRFDGVNTALGGLLNQTIDSGYFFAAFSVLGNGGEASGRVFGINSTGGFDYNSTGFIVSGHTGYTSDIDSYYGNVGWIPQHDGMFDDANGDILHEIKFQAGAQRSRANNADERNRTDTMDQISAEEFKIGALTLGGQDAVALDLEYLALFPATITDAQAEDVRNYINNRNNVFDLKDGFGYYFYDAQNAPVGNISSGSASWNGRIVGSDFGDTDRYLTQGTSNDAPVGDGFVVNFADNTDHLEIPQVTQAGWQVVGTSLGTFAYRVDNDAVTELNLLGNLGNASYRQAGDLYGIILLPESASAADIEEARKLLIDRGAADGTTASTVNVYFYGRGDIVEFKAISFSSATSLRYTWHQMSSLASFPSLDLTNAVDVNNAWSSCATLSSFGTTEITNCTDFTSAWKSCSALTSFPAGAKLGTEAASVNFSNAWESSGLTSFSTPLPTASSCSSSWWGCTSLASFNTQLPQATNARFAWYNNNSLSDFSTTDIKNCTDFTSAWQGTTALTSFPAGAKLGTEAENVNVSNAWQSSGLTSFSTPLPTANTLYLAWYGCSSLTSFSSDLSSVTYAGYAWTSCSSLTSFSTELPLCNRFVVAWQSCSSLTDFSAEVFANWNPSSITSGVFNNTWDGCTSLTAQSVENILTSIDASGKYATSTGASGGSALADAGIDIDYDGTTLSAATNAAVTSLKSKGWVIVVNGVTL